jgi:uncharacterized protein
MKHIFLFLLRGYRFFISPFVPTTCRFHPTCSEYMVQAIETKGLPKGLLSGVARLLKCHPLHPGGYDPVR